jgi:alanyl-tRNA synthetase
LKKGNLQKGDTVKAKIHSGRRYAIMRNHTVAHLLQSALRELLGEHVHQSGSYVDEYRCRFDFTHPQALTAGEIGLVEDLVNGTIFRNLLVNISEMPIEEAKKIGATALFGEKYGDTVRVVSIVSPNNYCQTCGAEYIERVFANNAISTELCGGCHVNNTAEIGLFKIISESSVASGIRRIEAVTGTGVIQMVRDLQYDIETEQENLKQASSANQKEVTRLNSIIANLQAKSAAIDEVGEIDGVKLFTQKIPGADANAIRQAGDKLKDSYSSFIAVIAGESNLFCICSAEAVAKGLKAGNIIREIAAVTGGKGGGKPDSAMAGIGDKSKVDEALSKLADIVKTI